MLVIFAGVKKNVIVVVVLNTQLVNASAALLTDNSGNYLKIA